MTTSISTKTSGITTQGIGSGLDIASIVDKLMGVEQLPLAKLQQREASFQTKVSAFSAARGMLSTFQNSVATLADPNAFSTFTTTIADAGVAAVAVDTTKAGGLSPGTHTLRVDRLASAQRTTSPALGSSTTVVGTGTLTIDVGAWDVGHTTFTPNGAIGSRSITIDPTNASLAGIRDAINRAAAGVTASIVDDGTGARLVLGSAATGAANGFRIRTSDTDGNDTDASGLSRLAFDPPSGATSSSALVDAANASFSLDGLAVSKPDNHVTDVVEGLTLDLKKQDATNTTTFTIARDTATAKKNVSSFVAAYNAVLANLGSLTSYNASTKAAGALNGDASLRIVASRLAGIVGASVATGGSVTTLADIGVKFVDDGKLAVDDTKLGAALARDPDAVGRLFAKTGTTSDALVRYEGSTDKTQAGTRALAVSTLATHGQVVGSTAAGLSIAAGVNDTIEVTVDNVAATITIPPGSYANAGALATALRSSINGNAALAAAGASVTVAASGGVLSIVSSRWGSASSVVVGGGNGASGLFGTPTSTAGADVAGTLDGTAFVGSGQVATGATSSAAEGLKLTVLGGGTGGRGSVSLVRGLAAQLDDALDRFLDDDDGVLHAATDGLNKSIKDLQGREASWNDRLVAIRARLTAQYNAMDSLVASLNSTSSYLTQQLDALKKSTSSSN